MFLLEAKSDNPSFNNHAYCCQKSKPRNPEPQLLPIDIRQPGHFLQQSASFSLRGICTTIFRCRLSTIPLFHLLDLRTMRMGQKRTLIQISVSASQRLIAVITKNGNLSSRKCHIVLCFKNLQPRNFQKRRAVKTLTRKTIECIMSI